MTEHQNFEELATAEFKVVGDPPPGGPDDTIARMQAAFAAAELFEKASDAAAVVGDEDDCRVLARLSENHADLLAVFHSLIRARIARPWQPDPGPAEAAELNQLLEELQEQHTAAATAAERLAILITYLGGGEELGDGDLEYAELVGPAAHDLPRYIANLGHQFRGPANRLSEIATAPSLSSLETRLANRPCDP